MAHGMRYTKEEKEEILRFRETHTFQEISAKNDAKSRLEQNLLEVTFRLGQNGYTKIAINHECWQLFL